MASLHPRTATSLPWGVPLFQFLPALPEVFESDLKETHSETSDGIDGDGSLCPESGFHINPVGTRNSIWVNDIKADIDTEG